MSACDEHVLIIDVAGKVRTIYEDHLPDLGKQEIFRAAFVNPKIDGSDWEIFFPATGERFTAKTKAEAYALEKRILQERLENA